MKKNGKYPSVILSNILGMFIITIVCAVSYRLMVVNNTVYETEAIAILLEDDKSVTKEDIVEKFIEDNNNLIEFYADTFQIKKDIIIEKIIELNDNEAEFNELDIFNKGKTFNSKDESILDYLFSLEMTNKKLFSNKRIPCNKSTNYILGLIDYYTTIYTDVDPVIAKAIGLVESGYTSKYMLSRNNIFGGMSGKGLIAYKNINYGVLMYIKMLHDGYFSKGLTTVSKIGYIYNPIVKNGKKQANPKWVSNVTRYMSRYSKKTDYSLEDLLSIK